MLAPAGALKPAIIIDRIMRYRLLAGYEMEMFAYGTPGVLCETCEQYQIPVTMLSSSKILPDLEAEEDLFGACNVLVSIGWSWRVPPEVIRHFDAALNCHGSILPDYKGVSAYMHAYANCEEYYGASVHYMTEAFDEGRVLIQGGLRATGHEDPAEMHMRTAELCAYLLPEALRRAEQGDEGYRPEGRDRYFLRQSPEEFEHYRQMNLERIRQGLEPVLTPHKTP